MVKSKVRFDGLDVAAMVAHWNRVALGRRVINIYNGPNGDTYLFKLDKHSGEASNLLLLLESGIRFHTTTESYENPGMPSPFCAKLRKHLRGLRLESVQQLGHKDRVILMTFGSGDAQRHTLILELYARGNLLLTNSNYVILSLLRSHDYDGAVKVQVGHAYPITYATTMEATTAATATTRTTMTTTTATTTTSEGVESRPDGADALDIVADSSSSPPPPPPPPSQSLLESSTDPMEWYQTHRPPTPTAADEALANTKGGGSKKKKKGGGGNAGENTNAEWRSLLLSSNSGVGHFSPSLIEHCLLWADIHPKEQSPSSLDADGWKRLQHSLQTEGERILASMEIADDSKGYIFYQPKKLKAEAEEKKEVTTISSTAAALFEDKLLLEFQPHILKQHEQGIMTNTMPPPLEFESFDRAVDAFFAHMESQKRVLRAETQQAQAEQRLEKIKQDQEQRVEQLFHQQELLKVQAQLVESHADLIDKAIQVVNSALDSGMDWDQLENLVQMEQTQNKNPVALLIHRLDLEHDAMVVRLDKQLVVTEGDDEEEEKDDDHDDDDGKTTMDVTIDLNETAFANASAMFAKYRASKEKGQKTIEASVKALQAAEDSAQRQVQDAQKRKSHLTTSLQTKRKPLWFEKFHWFITSDNYLVIAGRDAQQNEVIVKRYLRPGDAYLHADVHGAASCILRAKRRRTGGTGGAEEHGGGQKTQTLPLSDQALREAGNFTICRSSAWNSRMVTSAWWVESHQVSKTAPTGEYLTVGSFMIRGKKNYLPPTPLEMGLAVLFRLGDDEGIARHKNERRDFALMQLEAEDDDNAADHGEEEQQTLDLATEPAVSNTISHPKVEESDALDPLSLTDEVVSDDTEDAKEPHAPNTPLEEEEEDNAGNDDDDDDDDDDEGSQDQDSNKDDLVSVASSNKSKAKKGLSVKERKLIKKYGSLEAAQEAEEERLTSQQGKNGKQNKGNNSKAKDTGPAAPKRGKKTKLKRMAKKYADQDEEDRELALLALHAGEKDKKKEKKTAIEFSETAKEAAAQTIAILKKDPKLVAEEFSIPVKDMLAKCVTVAQADGSDEAPVVRWDKFDADVLEQLQGLELEEQKLAAAKRLATLKESTRIDNFSASLAGIIRTIRKYGHEGLETEIEKKPGQEARRKTKAEKENEKETWKQTLAEEGVVDEELEDDAVDDTVELGKLTGKPHPDDLVLFAVPVCAPYQTLSQYTYRVKLTPGNQKRGKASKQCIDMFMKEGQKTALSERSKELIKKVADTEWVHAMTGDVKISAAGASKIHKNKKNKKKK